MTTNWTPGPWVFEYSEGWICTEWRSTEHGLQVLIADMMKDEDTPNYTANAHLIAAAPELYHALRNLLEMHQAQHNAPAHASARAALRKARGEA